MLFQPYLTALPGLERMFLAHTMEMFRESEALIAILIPFFWDSLSFVVGSLWLASPPMVFVTVQNGSSCSRYHICMLHI